MTDDEHQSAGVADYGVVRGECAGAPGGFEADCGSPGPHAPHPIGWSVADLPQREPGAASKRLHVIAAIHAIADFFVNNPEVPVPSYITAGTYVQDPEQLLVLADKFGRPTYGSPAQFDYDVMGGEFDRSFMANVRVSVRPADRAL